MTQGIALGWLIAGPFALSGTGRPKCMTGSSLDAGAQGDSRAFLRRELPRSSSAITASLTSESVTIHYGRETMRRAQYLTLISRFTEILIELKGTSKNPNFATQ